METNHNENNPGAAHVPAKETGSKMWKALVKGLLNHDNPYKSS